MQLVTPLSTTITCTICHYQQHHPQLPPRNHPETSHTTNAPHNTTQHHPAPPCTTQHHPAPPCKKTHYPHDSLPPSTNTQYPAPSTHHIVLPRIMPHLPTTSQHHDRPSITMHHQAQCRTIQNHIEPHYATHER